MAGRPGRVLFSTAPESYGLAREELLGAFPHAQTDRLGPDLGALDAGETGIGDVATACREHPLVYVRHLAQEVARLSPGTTDEAAERAQAVVLALQPALRAGGQLALQTWASGDAAATGRPETLWHVVAARLADAGISVTRAGQDLTLSGCLTPAGIVLGLNRREDALADWPGGRVRLGRHPDQVSRAEFKLEELFAVYPVARPAAGRALDLGASPGGWTRVLRRAGLEVWAVDPADLHPRVAADPGVRLVRTTAGRFLAEPGPVFDLLVNDMRMVPDLSVRVVLDAAARLRPGGHAILTLKLPPRGQPRAVDEALASLRARYDVRFARQLFHNRQEVTVVGQCRT